MQILHCVVSSAKAKGPKHRELDLSPASQKDVLFDASLRLYTSSKTKAALFEALGISWNDYYFFLCVEKVSLFANQNGIHELFFLKLPSLFVTADG